MENKRKAIICLAVSSPVDLTHCKSIGGKTIVDNNNFKVVYKPGVKDKSK